MIVESVGWLSLLPPLIAITLVIITKESVFSLLIGGLAGCLVYSNWHLVKAVEMLFNIMTSKMSDNVYIILFLTLLGSLVMVMTESGGAMAYREWISKKIKSKTGSQIVTVLLGLLICIDDYFICLTIGMTMGPIFDKYKISREKLAYLIDSTAAPICIISPISSWCAFIISVLDGSGVKNSFEIFIETIPYNFYAIFTMIIVWFVILLKIDFGPMVRFEQLSGNKKFIGNLQSDSVKANNGKVRDLIIPIIVLIVCSIFSLLYNGGYFIDAQVTVLEALKITDSQKSLTYGVLAALVVSFFMVVPTKRLNFKGYMNSITDGVKSTAPAYMILILAWTVGGVCQEIGTGEYVKYIVKISNIPLWILPLVIFIVAGFLAFSTGTAWGTFGILIPVVIGLSQGMDDKLLILFLAATLAGAVYGDHTSPISDTSILSATGAQCKHVDHVISQMPYAGIVAGICCLIYGVIGIFRSLWIAYLIGVLCLVAVIYFLSKRRNEV